MVGVDLQMALGGFTLLIKTIMVLSLAHQLLAVFLPTLFLLFCSLAKVVRYFPGKERGNGRIFPWCRYRAFAGLL